MSLFSAKPISLARPAVTGPMIARVGGEAVPTGSAASGLGAGSIIVGAALIIGGVYYYQKVQQENRLQALQDRADWWQERRIDRDKRVLATLEPMPEAVRERFSDERVRLARLAKWDEVARVNEALRDERDREEAMYADTERDRYPSPLARFR